MSIEVKKRKKKKVKMSCWAKDTTLAAGFY